MRLRLLSIAAVVCLMSAAEKYDGPRPPKTDVPYILHANHLVETELGEAREQGGRNNTTYTIPGAASPAKTPLAEPIFIVDAKTLAPDQMELYRLEVNNGQRQVVMSQRRRHTPAGPFPPILTPLRHRLSKIATDQPPQNAAYCTPRHTATP